MTHRPDQRIREGLSLVDGADCPAWSPTPAITFPIVPEAAGSEVDVGYYLTPRPVLSLTRPRSTRSDNLNMEPINMKGDTKISNNSRRPSGDHSAGRQGRRKDSCAMVLPLQAGCVGDGLQMLRAPLGASAELTTRMT